MTDRDAIVIAAERLLDREGFSATGMDRLVREAGVSSRTLYKHVGGRAALILGALEARDTRFFAALPRRGVAALFTALEQWLSGEGAHGCFFLRALGEAGPADPGVGARVAAHKDAMAAHVAACVTHDLGRPDAALAEQVLVLFEGATHAAVYRGTRAVTVTAQAATTLIDAARDGGGGRDG